MLFRTRATRRQKVQSVASKVPTSSHQSDLAKPGYRLLLRTPGARAFVSSGFAARQPFAMLTISMVLLVKHSTGSYGTAGAAAAVTGVSMAVCAPRAGRLADRYGQRAVLVPGILLHAVAVGLFVALTALHSPAWTLLAAAVPAGATVPQVGPMVRSRWATALGDRGSPLLATAAAFESVTDELTFVMGPVIATALCTGVHPAAGLIAEAALTLVGGAVFTAQRAAAPAPHRAAGRDKAAPGVPALAVPGVRALVVGFTGIGTVFGGMQVSLTAFTQEMGRPGLNGILYGIFAAGNMLAGAVYGTISWRRGPRTRLLVAYGALTLACTPLWVTNSAVLLGALGVVVGLFIAPAIVTGYTLVDALVPPRARTEAFTWLTGSVALGQALAVTAAGFLTDRGGPHAGFTVPLMGTGLALAVLVTLRHRLAPPPRDMVAAGVFGHRAPVTVD